MILALPRPNESHMFDIEVCDKQIGCISLQEKPEGHAKAVGELVMSDK